MSASVAVSVTTAVRFSATTIGDAVDTTGTASSSSTTACADADASSTVYPSPGETVAVTVLAASLASSSSVATLSTARSDPEAKVAEAGGVPLSVVPVSVTETVTVSACVVSPVRVSAKPSAAPSVTGVAAGGATDTAGAVGEAGPRTVRRAFPASLRPLAPQAAYGAAQSVVVRTARVTSPEVSGTTLIRHRRFRPRSRRCARSMRPPSTSNSASRTVR